MSANYLSKTFFDLYCICKKKRFSFCVKNVALQVLVINLVGAYVSSAKYTRRGVKVVYLGLSITLSHWVVTRAVGARVTTQ